MAARMSEPLYTTEILRLAASLDEPQELERVEACAFGQASAALLARHSAGRTHHEVSDAMLALSRWLADEHEQPGGWPGIAALAPARTKRGRHGAILLPFRALLAAIEAAR